MTEAERAASRLEGPPPVPRPAMGSARADAAQSRLHALRKDSPSALAGPLTGTLILAVTLLGFGLRMYRLGEQSLWYDEAYTVLLALRSLPEMVASTSRDTLPPLYYALLHFWSIVGQGEIFWRFPSTWFGTLAIPLTYAVGRRLVNPPVGLGAALLIALSPFHLYFSQEARMYGLLTVLSLLTGYGFARGSQEGGCGPWALVAASGAVAVYTHPLAWFLLASLLVLRVIQRKMAAVRRPDMVLAVLAIGLAYLPWTQVLAQQARLVQYSFWAPAPTLVTPLASLYVFLYGPYLVAWQAAVGMVGLFLGLGLGITSIRSHEISLERRAALHLTLVWLVGPLLLAFAASQARPIYLERTLIGSSPALLLLVTWALISLRPRAVAFVLSSVMGTLLLVALGHAINDSAFSRPPFRAVASAIREQWEPGDVVVHTGDGSYLPFRLYLPDQPQALLAGDPEHLISSSRAQSTLRVIGVQPVPAEQAAAGHPRVWLVLAPDHSPEFQWAAAEDFGQGRTLLQDRTFDGIILRLYR